MIKKNIIFFTMLFFAAFVLAGCTDSANTNMTNVNMNVSSNSNVAIVTNNNMNAGNMNAMNTNTNMTGQTAGGTADSAFITEAAEGGMAEVEMGKLAASKAQNPEVRQFGQQMMSDHTRANNELRNLAAQKNVTLPTELNARHREGMDKLSKMSGAEFDREYMRMQVEDHEKTVSLFQNQADSGTDSDVRAFAAKTLPTLKTHLEQARNVQGKLK
jgi:putative membrane protein